MSVKEKKLKLWNGRAYVRGNTKQGTFYIAAYTQKECIELYKLASGFEMGAVNEIRSYYNSGCWGKAMDGIEATEPCVYFAQDYNTPPVKVYPIPQKK